jgi:uncharacterized protein YegJ (DUF2314 family)
MRVNRVLWTIVTIASVMPCSSCREASEVPQAPSAAGEPVPVGDLSNKQIKYQLAVYYLPVPTKGPLVELDKLLANEFTDLLRVGIISENLARPSLTARLETDVAKNYAPPDLEMLKICGKTLDRKQAESLQSCKEALILDFAYSKDHQWDGLKSALRLTESIARATGGLPWDETSREVYTPDEWKRQRLDSWTGPIPDVSTLTSIHAYKKNEYVRAVSLGMSKLGLPDIVVEEFSWTVNGSMGHLLNLFAQALAEGQRLTRPGEFDLDILSIKNPEGKDVAAIKKNATTEAPLTLRVGKREPRDPVNRLIVIEFDRGQGPDVHSRQQAILSGLFGAEDSVSLVKQDEELAAASRQARLKLPELRAKFSKGLAPGEYIQLKAPFKTLDGGTEYMWVEVISWDGDKVKGLLKNEPAHVLDLHAGQVVEILASTAFDFIHRYPDGRVEGNETGKIIEKQRPR